MQNSDVLTVTFTYILATHLHQVTTSEHNIATTSAKLHHQSELTCPGSHTVLPLLVKSCQDSGLLSSPSLHPLGLPLHYYQRESEGLRQNPTRQVMSQYGQNEGEGSLLPQNLAPLRYQDEYPAVPRLTCRC